MPADDRFFRRRDAVRLIVGAGLLTFTGLPRQARADAPLTSLKEKFARDFKIGVALGGNLPGDYSPEELSLIRSQFSVLTPENCMKMHAVQPAEGRFEFRQADALVEFARANGLGVCGHVLLWAKDERTPKWFFADGDRAAGKELLMKRLQAHVQALAGRYGNQIAYWDVVNEALADGKEGYLRPSKWLETGGPGYIAEAFKYAREASPGATLTYNDYDTEKPDKRAKMLRLLAELKEAKAPIGAVGLQGHFQTGRVPLKELDEMLTAIGELGLKAMISELDIAVVPRDRWWADGGAHREEMKASDPYKAACPPEVLERQAREYADLFRLFRRHAKVIERVTFWGLHDGRSWLNTFPWRHAEYPLLFDRQCRPKAAFGAVNAEAGD